MKIIVNIYKASVQKTEIFTCKNDRHKKAAQT